MGIRQPCVEGEYRHLNGKRKRKQNKQPGLHADRHVKLKQLEIIRRKDTIIQSRPGLNPQIDNGYQHQQRPDHRVDHKLDRRINALLAAPDTDQKVHRDQGQLKKDVEQQHIKSAENPRHPGLQYQQQGIIALGATGDVSPR